MRGANVFITGGAGFLGRAIIRQAIQEGWGSSFTIYSRDETKQDDLSRRFRGDVRLRCILGDVADEEHLRAAILGHDIVIHAAAVKYIPEAELNAWECNRVNNHGSEIVARAAGKAGADYCIGISTDKAVQPVNVYGSTKMDMERLFGEAGRWWPGTRYATARYGNVVGSTGSVIPAFARMARQDKRITITDFAMTRFWLSPDQAVDMIENVLDHMGSWPGGTFVNACPAMEIGDLALAVLQANDIDHSAVEFVHVGKRPGEKLNEDLLGYSEAPRALPWDNGWVVVPPGDPERAIDVPEPYTSADPRAWVGTDEMAEWIRDAKEV